MAEPEYVDLHAHSTASDGTLRPRDVVRLAQRSGLWGLALTDHDTTAGLADAADEAAKLGLAFLNGIEVSSTFPHPGTMHLLGYGIDPKSPTLSAMMKGLIEARNTRNPRIIAKLNELGIAITLEEVRMQAGGEVLGRPHIAGVLVRKGYASSIKQAFEKYLGTTGQAYFDKERLLPRRAIELIHEAGGVVSLAHPVQLRLENDAQLERVVKDLKDMGLDGIEVVHSDHSPAEVAKFINLAERLELLMTGGSDFHGANKKTIELGVANGRRIGRELMDRIVEAAEKRKAQPN